MATRNTAQAGLWSNPATWGGTVPVAGDVVNVEHPVTFDVDQSGWASGLGAVNLYAPLTASTAPGDYLLKLGSGTLTIQNGGQLAAGSAETPYPVTCTFTIQCTVANYHVNLNGCPNALMLYGATPAIPYVRMTADAAIGVTTLAVDTDVTADLWKVGDPVSVCDINRVREAEEYTIAEITPTTIRLSSGLTVAKTAGAVIALGRRNVRIIGAGTASNMYATTGSATLAAPAVIRAELRSAYRAANGSYIDFSGALFVFCGTGVYTGNYLTFVGTLFVNCSTLGAGTPIRSVFRQAVAIGCATAFSAGLASVFEDCEAIGCGIGFSGLAGCIVTRCRAYGCTNGFASNTNSYHNACTADRCTYAVQNSEASRFVVCVFGAVEANTSGDVYVYGRGMVFFNCTLASPNKVRTYDYGWWSQCIHYVDQGADRLMYAWMNGGRIEPDFAVKPDGAGWAHKFIFEVADSEVFLDIPVQMIAGREYRYTVMLRRSVETMQENPKVRIIDPEDDPFMGGTPLVEWEAEGSADEWEQIDVTFTAPKTAQYIVRIRAQHTSGNMWATWSVPPVYPEVVDRVLTSAIVPDVITAEVVE